MRNPPDISSELSTVRRLLLNATVDSVWECERKLSDIVVSIQMSESQLITSSELAKWTGEIRSLLDGAMRFWQMRNFMSASPECYSPDGLLRQTSAAPALLLEI